MLLSVALETEVIIFSVSIQGKYTLGMPCNRLLSAVLGQFIGNSYGR